MTVDCIEDIGARTGRAPAARAHIGHYGDGRAQYLPDDDAHRAVETARRVHLDNDYRCVIGCGALKPADDVIEAAGPMAPLMNNTGAVRPVCAEPGRVHNASKLRVRQIRAWIHRHRGKAGRVCG